MDYSSGAAEKGMCWTTAVGQQRRVCIGLQQWGSREGYALDHSSGAAEKGMCWTIAVVQQRRVCIGLQQWGSREDLSYVD